MEATNFAAYFSEENETMECVSISSMHHRVNKTVPYMIASSVLSLLGSLLTVITFALWRDLRRSTARQILLFLAIADFFTAAGYFAAGATHRRFFSGDHIVNVSEHIFDPFCAAQSFVVAMFSTASFFWTTYLAVYFVLVLVFGIYHWSKRLIVFFNFTAWCIPLAICVTAVALRYLGYGNVALDATPGMCFVSSRFTMKYNTSSASIFNEGIVKYLLMEALCMKLWEFLAMLTISVCYVMIFIFNRCFVHQRYQHPLPKPRTARMPVSAATQHRSPSAVMSTPEGLNAYSKLVLIKSIQKVDLKFLTIPAIFILFRLWGTIRYFVSMRPDCHQYPGILDEHNNKTICMESSCFEIFYHPILLYTQALFDPLQGFGNAILFIFLSKVIMRRLFSSVKSCYQFSTCAYSSKLKHRLEGASNFREKTNEREPLIQQSPALPYERSLSTESDSNW